MTTPPFGVLNLNKPLHCTSHDVVNQVRKALGLKKVGHAGTLDPLASGVLPLCVGQATRLIEYFPSDKRYRAHITFGAVTTTWDAEADRLHPLDASALTVDTLQTYLNDFQGEVVQTVPPHSAVHVNGKKLYELTRQGKTVELPTRSVTLYETRLVELLDEGSPTPTAILDIHCSTGTYIRSIAWALGQQSGFGAYLSGLVRTAHGAFALDDAVDLENFMQNANPAQYLQAPETYLPFETLEFNAEVAKKLQFGQKLEETDLPQPINRGKNYILTHENQLLGIGLGEVKQRLRPVKMMSMSDKG